MALLHPVSDFIEGDSAVGNLPASYYYEGRCPLSGDLLRLPRSPLSEAIARGLMQHLSSDRCYVGEGKMYGILLVELPNGEQRVLKAFSGLLNSQSVVEGWVEPIPGREEVALEEARTLAELDAIKLELLALKQRQERQQYETLSRQFEKDLQDLSDRHRQNQQQRRERRQRLGETLAGDALAVALEQLDGESRRDGIERRLLKRQHSAALQPLKQAVELADLRIQELKKRRKELSRQLQAQMHAAYSLTNFAGQSLSLQELMPAGSMPTGTGDCCAPKLLHYAATRGLKPLALAEFWWGLPSAKGDKIPGEFYGACAERCQPLMGFLLSGLSEKSAVASRQFGERAGSATEEIALPILYEDEWLIAANKPAGLLSVPGRSSERFDSALSRLRHVLPDGMSLVAVHRLDRDTSGILLLARDRETYCQLSRQFQQRQVGKIYEAVLAGIVPADCGEIDLPLWGNPENRPYQTVDEQRGKPSVTRFRVMAREGNLTRVEFVPLTGRSHQIRVHAADARGLGIPILGDRLYGCRAGAGRLHLHARELAIEHPQSRQILHLHAPTPF